MAVALSSNLALAQDDVAELRRQGDEAFDRFENLTALGYYEKAWLIDKQDPQLLSRLTWTCNNVGEDLDSKESELYFEKAIAYSEELKELAPDDSLTWFLSAITSGNLGLHRGGKQKVTLSRHVAEDAQKCIALDPDYAPGYVVMGVYYREVASLNPFLRLIAKRLLGGLPSGTLEDAESMLLQGVEKDPKSGYAYFQLATTYEAMKEPAKAIANYQKMIELPVTDHQDPTFKEVAKERIDKLSKKK